MIRIVIIEDNETESNMLQGYLEKYVNEQKIEAKWNSFTSGEAFLESGEKDFDLVFMDVELGGINGIETSKQIRLYNQEVNIILITNLLQYAIQGYSIRATDYIVKPIGYEDFEIKMKEYCHMIEKKNSSIMFKVGHDYKKFKIRDIGFVEVYGHKIYIHTKDKKEQVTGTLKEIEKDLIPHGFAKCNKCYLVNLEHVEGITGDHVEVNGELLQISRRTKTDFIYQLTKHTKG